MWSRMVVRSSLVGVLICALSSSAFAADPVPVRFGLKLGVGLPGIPGIGAEAVVREMWSLQAEGGNGLLGPYGSISARRRYCWGCDGTFAFVLPAGPGITAIRNNVTSLIVAVEAEPTLLARFSDRFALTLGVKIAIGVTSDIGTTVSKVEPGGLFMLSLGALF